MIGAFIEVDEGFSGVMDHLGGRAGIRFGLIRALNRSPYYFGGYIVFSELKKAPSRNGWTLFSIEVIEQEGIHLVTGI